MDGQCRRSSEYSLSRALIALSNGKTWDVAKKEWRLISIFFATADDPGRCLCGHHPIIEQCVIGNVENGTEAIVGNVCVKKFLGLPSEQLFSAIRRIAADKEAALNCTAIVYAHEKGWITNWERCFYLDTCRQQRRNLSPKQLTIRSEINQTILRRLGEDSHA